MIKLTFAIMKRLCALEPQFMVYDRFGIFMFIGKKIRLSKNSMEAFISSLLIVN